ncbi:MAG: hypothetical protein A3F43_01850 [Gammaproteobacteria bacterium RIFCSPHIGHO2_12_FULL_42_10]|nr:MAG: hypothetical protein A3F43_01850 [Gammaproteobacteria bacterium RIFCSPHIGHO2_12_FULL_42_10]
MLKKLSIAAAVLAISTSVGFAGYKDKNDFKGEGMMKDSAPCQVASDMFGPYIGLSVGSRNNYSGLPAVFRGVDLNASVGYGYMAAPEFYIGGEVFGIWTGNSKDLPAWSGASVKSNWGWGLSVLPGYMVTDHVLGYVRLGGIDTNFNGAQLSNTSKWAWQVGPGAQVSLDRNWDLRGEYLYSQYSGTSQTGHISSDVFNLGLVYKFV